MFIARVPNAVSPTGGHLIFGDITDRTWFTQRGIRQLAAVAKFKSVRTFTCPPVVHGPTSAVRAALWKPISGPTKLSLHIVTHNLTFAADRDAHHPQAMP